MYGFQRKQEIVTENPEDPTILMWEPPRLRTRHARTEVAAAEEGSHVLLDLFRSAHIYAFTREQISTESAVQSN